MSKDSSAKYYRNYKERLQKKLVRDIKVVLKKKKEEKQQYDFEQYKNLPEDEKQKPVKYRKKRYKMRNSLYYDYKILLF